MQDRQNGRSESRAAVVLALLLLGGGLALPAPAGAIEIQVTSLGNGQAGATVAFPSAGSDSSLALSIQTGLVATSVFLNLSGGPFSAGGADCPLAPSLDLGADGSIEWCFNGTGYGALGHQSLFSDGGVQSVVVFAGAGQNDSTVIRLPAGATASGRIRRGIPPPR